MIVNVVCDGCGKLSSGGEQYVGLKHAYCDNEPKGKWQLAKNQEKKDKPLGMTCHHCGFISSIHLTKGLDEKNIACHKCHLPFPLHELKAFFEAWDTPLDLPDEESEEEVTEKYELVFSLGETGPCIACRGTMAGWLFDRPLCSLCAKSAFGDYAPVTYQILSLTEQELQKCYKQATSLVKYLPVAQLLLAHFPHLAGDTAPKAPASKRPKNWIEALSPYQTEQGKIRTQKAKGVAALMTFPSAGLEDIKRIPCLIIQGKLYKSDGPLATKLRWMWARAQVQDAHGNNTIHVRHALFIRPCPMTPRHGFEDSIPLFVGEIEGDERQVKNAVIDRINELFAKATEADEQAELLIMPLVEADCNMIAAGPILTIGPGNDGATSGKDSMSLPTMPLMINHRLLSASGIKQTPFVELVAFNGQISVTQLRDGPKPATGASFIPKPMTVTEIIPAEGSLLDWERAVKTFKNRPGLIVSHIGGNLASHYAIHCQLNDVPITCEEVAVGDKLEPTVDEERVTEPDREWLRVALLEALSWGDVRVQCDPYRLLPLYALHSFPAFDMSNPLHTRIMGHALAVTVRLAVAACWGEHRHGERYNYEAEMAQIDGAGNPDRIKRPARFAEVLRITDFDTMMPEWAAKCRGMVFPPFHEWNNSVAGMKWLACSDRTFGLWNAICDYLAHKVSFAVVIECLNGVINISHNGSKLLTKFIPIDEFTKAAQNPGLLAIRLAPTIARLAKEPIDGYSITCNFQPVKLPSDYFAEDSAIMRKYLLTVLCDYDTTMARVVAQWFDGLRMGHGRMRPFTEFGAHSFDCTKRILGKEYDNHWIDRLTYAVVRRAIMIIRGQVAQ